MYVLTRTFLFCVQAEGIHKQSTLWGVSFALPLAECGVVFVFVMCSTAVRFHVVDIHYLLNEGLDLLGLTIPQVSCSYHTVIKISGYTLYFCI